MNSSTKNNAVVTRFLATLRLAGTPGDKKTMSRLQSRLIGLGFGNTCGRCGGSGNHSYCQMYGTTCFGCGGTGFVAQKLSAALLARVEVVVSAGALDRYLADVAERSAARKLVKSATDRIFAAWDATGIKDSYDWTKAHGTRQTAYDHEMSEVNALIAAEYEKVAKAVSAVSHAEFVRGQAKDAAEQAAATAARDEAVNAVGVAVVAAETRIAELGKLVPEVKARHGR